MIICLCHRVSDRDIAREVAHGCGSFEDLQDQTRVATGCGACFEYAQEAFSAHAGRGCHDNRGCPGTCCGSACAGAFQGAHSGVSGDRNHGAHGGHGAHNAPRPSHPPITAPPPPRQAMSATGA